MKKRVDSLNLIRIGLIFTIFVCHSNDFVPEVFGYYAGTLTGYALQLFFMISGFCCLLSGWSKELHTISYVKKRWWKIFPMYFIAFALMAVLIIYRAWAGGYEIDKSDFLAQAVVNLTFLQAWTPNEDFVYSFNGVSWFLSALFFCYLLTPVMIRVLKRFENYAPWLFVTVAFVQFGYALYFNHFIGTGSFCYTNVFPPYRFLEYLMGALLAVMYIKRRDGEGIPRSSAVQLFTVFLFFAAYVITKHEMGFTRFFIVLELYLMYALCLYEGKVSDWGGIEAGNLARQQHHAVLSHSFGCAEIHPRIHRAVHRRNHAHACRALGFGIGRFHRVQLRIHGRRQARARRMAASQSGVIRQRQKQNGGGRHLPR